MGVARLLTHVLGLSVLSALSAAGCLLVTPLEDLPGPVPLGGSGGKPPMSGQAGAADDGGEGATGAEAGSGGASGEGGTAGSPTDGGPCQTNAECMQRFAEEPARCRPSDHTCVPLLNDVCPLAYGYPEDPNAIFFGTFTTFNPSALEDNSIAWAHRLAVEELSGRNIGGLPDGPGGVRRPLAMLLCSNLSKDVDAAMEHLAEEVQVPAVIATLRPGDLRRAFEAHQKRDILYLSPVTVTQTLVDQDERHLMWNLLGTPANLAPAYGPLLTLTESFLREERALAEEIPLRVAVVTSKEAFDSELGEAVPGFLKFNGKTTAENGTNYRGFQLDPADPQLTEKAWDIIGFRPHVIISTASELLSADNGLLEVVETDWGLTNLPGTKAERDFRPQWILSPFNAGDLSWMRGFIKDWIEFTAEPMNQRIVGLSIASAADNTLQNAYATRLRTAFPDAYVDSANYYDAVYYLAYGMYAAGTEEPLSGPGIARGLGRLLAGAPFNVGPKAISGVLKQLAGKKTEVALTSTLGPPTFDADTGVRPVEASVFCFKSETGVQLNVDVLRYDAQANELVGAAFPCFDGFYP
jgi:hypothetical protein